MGAQAKGNMADPRQRQIINEKMRRESPVSNQQRPQKQEMVEREQQQKQEMVEREQQQRAQQQSLADHVRDRIGRIPTPLRDSAAAREKNNIGPTRYTYTSSSEYFDQDKFNRLKTEIDRQQQYEVDKRSQFDQDKFNRLKTEIDRQQQYEVDKRSQYESLRDKVAFEDAYADRGLAAAREKNNIGPTRDTSSSEYFDQDKFNRLKTEIDQQRSRNNTGIAFGPGRSYRGNVALGIRSRNQMRKGN